MIWLLVSIVVFEYIFLPLQARRFAAQSFHWGGRRVDSEVLDHRRIKEEVRRWSLNELFLERL